MTPAVIPDVPVSTALSMLTINIAVMAVSNIQLALTTIYGLVPRLALHIVPVVNIQMLLTICVNLVIQTVLHALDRQIFNAQPVLQPHIN